MKDIRLIEIGEEIRGDNDREAERVRNRLTLAGVRMINIMASPGAGKTSVILRSLEALQDTGGRREHPIRCAVLEADMDSMVDSEKIIAAGTTAVQIRTGGFCHTDARMVAKSIDTLDLEALDLIFLENVGNLICPAQFDTGAHANVMILSVPEGDDKPLKYPLMFRSCSALVVNKIDYLEMSDFNMKILYERVEKLNREMRIFPLSCRTGEGIIPWIDWVYGVADN